ncbi:alkaline phosphatase family protein [Flagellimonas olearia]|uniref:Alkaline phosphatase family protein n=1 Tax=Flagellimonas olearia TaxID=552546 RepID=A0A6I1E2S9_9FLAO|nr:alkaline phosphatase PafA [Allomuricauda olearia]KAB7530261.1 alkaline phosphatase family protein [Allomuricauda olearia]
MNLLNSIKTILFFMVAAVTSFTYAQNGGQPKLVVGVVVDQMRYEYLYRFQDNFTEDGFKRLMREGFNAKNTHYNYVPTATCLGHATIYTGTTPSNHGIVSNSWYSRDLKRKMYCVEDSTVFLINHSGMERSTANKHFSRSPKNIRTTTITDELKLFTNGRSKVIGLSIKDRSAISPAGHLADAAYWYNGKTGDFVTSSYYLEELPDWLKVFNASKKADSLLDLSWKPLLPIGHYRNSTVDDDGFEKVFKGKEKSVFPYHLKELRESNGNYGLIAETPFGNTILTQLIKAAIQGEKLGQGLETDFLAVSYSSTDYVGHNFGIRSKEMEDTYVRMDREIGCLLKTLDQHVGKGNYILFLTADHGASDHPTFLKSKQIPGEFYSTKQLNKVLNDHLKAVLGDDDYVAFFDSTQIYFNETSVQKNRVIKEAVVFLNSVDGIKEVFAPSILDWNLGNSGMGEFIKNSFSPEESGDIIYHTYPGWMNERAFGTTHGTSYTSDTHVPLLWYGWGIPNGESVKQTRITQIAPTLSFLLNIPLPNSSDGQAIEELFSR